MYLLAFYIPSLERCLCQSFAHFYLGWCFCYWVLCFGYKRLNKYMVCIFFPFYRLSFHFVDGFCCCEEDFWFEAVTLVYFLFCCLCFRYHIPKWFPRSTSRTSVPMFCCRSFRKPQNINSYSMYWILGDLAFVGCVDTFVCVHVYVLNLVHWAYIAFLIKEKIFLHIELS